MYIAFKKYLKIPHNLNFGKKGIYNKITTISLKDLKLSLFINNMLIFLESSNLNADYIHFMKK